MESLQNVLGEHQDSVTAQALLLELTMTYHLSAESGFAFGLGLDRMPMVRHGIGDILLWQD